MCYLRKIIVLFAQSLLHFEHDGAKLHGIKIEEDRNGGTPVSRRDTPTGKPFCTMEECL